MRDFLGFGAIITSFPPFVNDATLGGDGPGALKLNPARGAPLSLNGPADLALAARFDSFFLDTLLFLDVDAHVSILGRLFDILHLQYIKS